MSRPVAAAALALALTLTACSSDTDSETSTKPTAADEKSSAAGAGDRVAPKNLPQVPQLRQAAGAVSDLTIGDCPVGPGEQTVTGTLTGSGKKPRDYVVVISWTNDRSDVRGRAVVVEKAVEPGESRDVKATATVVEGAKQCVPNVQAGQLKN